MFYEPSIFSLTNLAQLWTSWEHDEIYGKVRMIEKTRK